MKLKMQNIMIEYLVGFLTRKFSLCADRVGEGARSPPLCTRAFEDARAWPFGVTLVGIGGRPMGARMGTSRAGKDRV